jgi:hypothetical protein
MQKTFYTSTIIIGAGPCGITLANLIKEKEEFKVLVSLHETRWTKKYSDKYINHYKNSLPVFDPNQEWGNQHDTNIFQNLGTPSSLSDLAPLLINTNELKKPSRKLSELGWPAASFINPFKETFQFKKKLIVRMHTNRKLIKMRANIEKNVVYFSKLDLVKKRDSKYILRVDEDTYICQNLVFATGGKANFRFSKEVINKYYPNLKTKHVMLGRGYANHPKAIIAEIEVKKFLRYIKKSIVNDYIYSWSKFYEAGQFSFRLFPKKSYSGIRGILESIIITFGYCKKFSVMMYCESPVNKINTIDFISSNTKLGKYEINYHLNELFMETANDFQTDAISFIDTLSPIKNIKLSNWKIDDLLKDQFHYFGTTRMGSNFSNSVVNRVGRMHGTTGIYFIGTSVLPIARSEHPTYLAMVLSVLTADEIILEK